jgi:hypothetical protein
MKKQRTHWNCVKWWQVAFIGLMIGWMYFANVIASNSSCPSEWWNGFGFMLLTLFLAGVFIFLCPNGD